MLLAVVFLLFQLGLITYGDDLCPVSKITSAGRENILKKLNDIRTKVAMGQFSTSDGTYPAAKEMYKLKLAQEHVDKCHYDRSEYFLKYFYGDGVGETLFANWTLENDPKDDMLSVAVDEWLKSKPMGETSLSMDKYFETSNEDLAQLITARTTEIGCGVSFCEYPKHRPYYLQFITCNYYPSGQKWYTTLYESGEKCKSDAQCTTYASSKCLSSEGLCTRELKEKEEPENTKELEEISEESKEGEGQEEESKEEEEPEEEPKESEELEEKSEESKEEEEPEEEPEESEELEEKSEEPKEEEEPEEEPEESEELEEKSEEPKEEEEPEEEPEESEELEEK
ncbi:unnamed protein product, partial [Dracunculus medinensis]|uniref:SCP domain-containing protein n=1 Tax=Dracunculus medinensis TaxID=318479 RepID=A0A0N4UQ81_DRAME